MKTYCNSSTEITLHAKRYTTGVLKGSWRGYVKITHRATIDGKDHVCHMYEYQPAYMGHNTREDAIKTARQIKDRMM